jgi:hypothetical protein
MLQVTTRRAQLNERRRPQNEGGEDNKAQQSPTHRRRLPLPKEQLSQ